MYNIYRYKGIRVIGTRVVVLVSNIHPVDSSQEGGGGEVCADSLIKFRRLWKCSDVCRNVQTVPIWPCNHPTSELH